MPIDNADFEYIRKLVRDRTGVALAEDKTYLVESRLTPLAQETGAISVGELVAQLRTKSFNCLHEQVVEAMMTTETFFFRDAHPFEALKQFVLPELIKQRQVERALNIWCAACSSGQEPYSIAILLRENFPQLATWTVSLIASDISSKMLSFARAGRYNQHEISRGLTQALREKYFHPQGKEWQIEENIRRMVQFRQFNLAETWSRMPPIDIIFLRNVLIYFDVEMKQAILANVRRLLRPDGYLFLGGGETTLNLDDAFETVQFNKAVCYRLRN